MDEMVKRGIYWVPTIVVGRVRCARPSGNWTKLVDLEKGLRFRKPRKKGVKIALGTDARGFDWKKTHARAGISVLRGHGIVADAGDSHRNFGGRRIIGLAGKI